MNDSIIGNMRRVVILLKIWAHTNSLFFDESNKNEKSHWNSYTLTLLVISFFQSTGRIPLINFISTGKTVGKWLIEYQLSHYDLSDLSLSLIFKVNF